MIKIKVSWLVIALWFAASLVLIYDGLFDVLTSTNHLAVFDAAEAVIGMILLSLFIVNMKKRF